MVSENAASRLGSRMFRYGWTDATTVIAEDNPVVEIPDGVIYPHWEAYIEMSETADGSTPAVASSGDVTVVPNNGNFDESPAANVIDTAAPTSVNWSGHTASVAFTGFAGVTEGDASYFDLVVIGHPA